jgi:cyclic pyranopterin phosphate synthase
LRISVIDQCNFRCNYCMPSEVFGEDYDFLSPEAYLTFDEITRVVRLFSRVGVRKIRLTGGEPLLRAGLDRLIRKISRVERIQDLALTTNAFLLGDRAADLQRVGLDRVTVSLDALDDDVFRAVNGVERSNEKVLAGIDAARAAGLTPVKVNVVVQRGVNESEILPLVRRFRGTGVIVRFIEYMDVGTRNGWCREDVVPSAEVKERIASEIELKPLGANYPGEVADRYALADGSGEIGFVSSITQPFCGSCTRARLSTQGELYTCLFASDGADFRALLRGGASDDDLLARLEAVWGRRDDRYSEERAADAASSPPEDRIEMYEIGG